MNHNNDWKFDDIDDALTALARGNVIILVDSEEREDEGDFVASAEKITPETIHFMAGRGRGQLCVPVVPGVAERLDLQLMVSSNDLDAPKFAVPVDHHACRTGISPLERASTIHSVLDESTTAADFVRPGHVFPLIAHPGGVLARSGHTEASIELMRLANLNPASVLCEICSDDRRHMASHVELFETGMRFGLPIISIEQIIETAQRDSPYLPELPESVDCQHVQLCG